MSQTVLMVSPYIIDVPLSTGGLLAKHAEAGDRVVVLSMCYPGVPSRVVYPEARRDEASLYGRFETKDNFEQQVARRERDAVVRELGIDSIVTWDYAPDSHQLFAMETVDRMETLLNELQPDIAIAYWPISNYADFSGSTMALLRAIQERPVKRIPQIYFAETLTGRHTLCFTPSIWVDITAVIHKKRAAAGVIWEGKNLDYFFNTHSLPVSQFRGRECGCDHAEAYIALHGGFGLGKRPTGATAGSNPVTMQRLAERLTGGMFADGVQPHCYGVNGTIDNATVAKVYSVFCRQGLAP